MKIKIHSIVDLITNSSTTIFTYSAGSLSVLEELVNEMLKEFGRTEKFEDLFYAKTFLEYDYGYIDYYNDHLIDYCLGTKRINENDLETLRQEILTGKQEKPAWMIEAEYYNDCSSTILEIKAKDEKNEKLANLLITYLYSPDYEAVYEG